MDKKVGDQKAISQFLHSYPLKERVESLEYFQDSFPVYRPIYGDGNCFYRAFAFMYLRNASAPSFETLFKKVKVVCEIRGHLAHLSNNLYKKLEEYWKRELSGIISEQNIQKKEAMIQKLFNNGNEEFDTLIILYFRSLNYANISLNRKNLTDFMESPRAFDEALQRIKTFGQQSEGVQIDSLSEYFNVGLTVISVREGNLHPIVYDHYRNPGFYFFYRPGHYDIIYPVLESSPKNQPLKAPPLAEKKNFSFSFTNLLNRKSSKQKKSPSQISQKTEKKQDKITFSKQKDHRIGKNLLKKQQKINMPANSYIKDGPSTIGHKLVVEFFAIVLLGSMVAWMWF